MLLLIILPFFISLIVLRTVAWQLILTDDGWVVNAFADARPARRRTAACWPRARP